MILFILKRLFYLILSIPLVVLFGFLLIKSSPIDQVERLINQGEFSLDNEAYAKIYKSTAKLHGLDLPLFYFSINTSNYTADYHNILLPSKKKFYKNLLAESLEYDAIDQFYQQLIEAGAFAQKEEKNFIAQILNSTSLEEIQALFNKVNRNNQLWNSNLENSFINLQSSKSLSYKLIPKLIWHGSLNQYHQSLKNIVSFNLGKSMRDGRSVSIKLWNAFSLSCLMLILSFLLCFPFAIWLGKKMFLHENKTWPKVVETILFALASIPLFWFATLALSFLTTPEYSKWLNIFPNVSNFDFQLRDHFWKGVFKNIHQLILPILCIILLELAIVTRQVINLLKKENNAPYINTARMKGLSMLKIINKHAYRSARIQMVTMMSAGIIGALSGSVVIEYIFNIPGMGRLLLDSIHFSDWPVIMAIILLIYFLSNIILSLSDIISQYLDPRLNLFGNE